MPNPPPPRPAAAPGPLVADAVANAAANAVPAPRAQAPPPDPDVVRRFVDAALRDEEDGWNSDELPDADGFDDGVDSDDDHEQDRDLAVPEELMRRIDARDMLNRWNRR